MKKSLVLVWSEQHDVSSLLLDCLAGGNCVYLCKENQAGVARCEQVTNLGSGS